MNTKRLFLFGLIGTVCLTTSVATAGSRSSRGSGGSAMASRGGMSRPSFSASRPSFSSMSRMTASRPAFAARSNMGMTSASQFRNSGSASARRFNGGSRISPRIASTTPGNASFSGKRNFVAGSNRQWAGNGNSNRQWAGNGNSNRQWAGNGNSTRRWNGNGNSNRRWAGNGNSTRHWSGNCNNGHHHHGHHHHNHFFVGGFYPYSWYYPWSWYDDYGYYSSVQPVVYDGAASYDDGSLVAQLQNGLAGKGYYRGAIDGVMGPQTRRAIRAFERAHGLPVDGLIDDQLLSTMGLG